MHRSAERSERGRAEGEGVVEEEVEEVDHLCLLLSLGNLLGWG